MNSKILLLTLLTSFSAFATDVCTIERSTSEGRNLNCTNDTGVPALRTTLIRRSYTETMNEYGGFYERHKAYVVKELINLGYVPNGSELFIKN